MESLKLSGNHGFLSAMASDIEMGILAARDRETRETSERVTAERRAREYARDPRNCGDYLERLKCK